jgi:hypothetical protein
MASFPPNYIPIGDAFHKAVDALAPLAIAGPTEDPNDLSGAELVKFEAGLKEFFQRNDEAKRKVERLFRDALADGVLDAWVNGRQGMEMLSDRDSWRSASVGIPGFESRTHHLTNPGPDDERQVFIERGQLKTWIAVTETRQPTDDELDGVIRRIVKREGRVPGQNECADLVRAESPRATRDRVRNRLTQMFPGLKQGRGSRKKSAQ